MKWVLAALSILSAIVVGAPEDETPVSFWDDLTSGQQPVPSCPLENEARISLEYNVPWVMRVSRSSELEYFMEASDPWLAGVHERLSMGTAKVSYDQSPLSTWPSIWMTGADTIEGYH